MIIERIIQLVPVAGIAITSYLAGKYRGFAVTAEPSKQQSIRSSQFAVRSSQFAVRSSQFAVRSSQFAVRSSHARKAPIHIPHESIPEAIHRFTMQYD
jgi:hypothetical protein